MKTRKNHTTHTSKHLRLNEARLYCHCCCCCYCGPYSGVFGGWALIAFGEETKGVDLPNEIGHARPPSEPEADHQHPQHHKHIHNIHPRPARQEEGRLLRCILHTPNPPQKFTCMIVLFP